MQDAFILTLAGNVAVPRRIRLDLAPGDGTLHIEGPPRDASWTASVQNAWRHARLLAGDSAEPARDGRLTVASSTPLSGGSSGLPVGLLALAALCGRRLPPHFATGTVLDDGFLEGGAHAGVKAAAAAQAGQQLGIGAAPLLCPPLERPVDARDGLRAVAPTIPAADVASAFATLDAPGYAGIRHRHERLRDAQTWVPRDGRAVDTAAPFALLHAASVEPNEEGVQWTRIGQRPGDDRQVPDPASAPASASPAWLAVGERGHVLWRRRFPAEGPVPSLRTSLELARRSNPL